MTKKRLVRWLLSKFTVPGRVILSALIYYAGWKSHEHSLRIAGYDKVPFNVDNYRAVVYDLCTSGNNPGPPRLWVGALQDGRIDQSQFDQCADAWEQARQAARESGRTEPLEKAHMAGQ